MKLKINRVIKNWKYSKDIIVEDNEFIPNGFGRRYKKQLSEKHWKKAFKEFGLSPTKVEPTLTNFTGNHFLEGAAVQEHIDQAPEGYVHTRCNVMLKKPKIGGNPILDGEEIEIEQNDMWLCLASLERHWSTPISGGERLVFSFGAYVPMKQIKKII
jgi:hypothetical protein